MELKPEKISEVIRSQIKYYENAIIQNETGTVLTVGDGIARVSGLTNCMSGELLEFQDGTYGMAQNLEETSVSAVLFGSDVGIQEGQTAKRTGRVVSVPVGEAMIGRVVNAIGQPIDGAGPIESSEFRAVESPAPGIIKRQPVKEPLQTGIKAIDSMIPIGRGQRELIIGEGRPLHLRGHRSEEIDRDRSRERAEGGGGDGLFHRRRGDGLRAEPAPVHRPLLGLRDGGVLHESGEACPDYLR